MMVGIRKGIKNLPILIDLIDQTHYDMKYQFEIITKRTEYIILDYKHKVTLIFVSPINSMSTHP